MSPPVILTFMVRAPCFLACVIKRGIVFSSNMKRGGFFIRFCTISEIASSSRDGSLSLMVFVLENRLQFETSGSLVDENLLICKVLVTENNVGLLNEWAICGSLLCSFHFHLEWIFDLKQCWYLFIISTRNLNTKLNDSSHLKFFWIRTNFFLNYTYMPIIVKAHNGTSYIKEIWYVAVCLEWIWFSGTGKNCAGLYHCYFFPIYY